MRAKKKHDAGVITTIPVLVLLPSVVGWFQLGNLIFLCIILNLSFNIRFLAYKNPIRPWDMAITRYGLPHKYFSVFNRPDRIVAEVTRCNSRVLSRGVQYE